MVFLIQIRYLVNCQFAKMWGRTHEAINLLIQVVHFYIAKITIDHISMLFVHSMNSEFCIESIFRF